MSSSNVCFAGLWHNWRIVPQDSPKGRPGTVPFGKSAVYFPTLSCISPSCRKGLCADNGVFVNSGCSCPTLSSVPSWCCLHLHTWTTEPPVSATETSLRSVTCAQCACRVSLIPSLDKRLYDVKVCDIVWFSFAVFCNFSPICTTCEWVDLWMLCVFPFLLCQHYEL